MSTLEMLIPGPDITQFGLKVFTYDPAEMAVQALDSADGIVPESAVINAVIIFQRDLRAKTEQIVIPFHLETGISQRLRAVLGDFRGMGLPNRNRQAEVGSD